jgi:hypothetical protein
VPTDSTRPESPEIEVYSNSMNFTVGAFDCFLDFTTQSPEDLKPKPRVRVRMSLQHAWVLAKIIDRTFTKYIADGNRFTLPADVLNQLGLWEEYREDFGSEPSGPRL